MIPYNNCDKLSIVKLLIILKIFQQSYCNENINEPSKKNSTNVKHKDNVNPNNLSVKKDPKNKPNTKCILPVQEVTIKDHTKSIKKKGESNNTTANNIKYGTNVTPNNLSVKKNSKGKIDTECILPVQEVNIEDDRKCINKNIKKKCEINNAANTASDVYEIPESINTNHSENFISTLPIIIAEKNIDIPIEATFKLKTAALDIKNMKKDVYLTTSKLIPIYEKHDISPSLYGKLFLEGFIRNKVDFSIAKGVHDKIINLDTECVIIYIPFKCTTLIQYKIPPVFSNEKPLDYIPIYISSDCVDINKDYDENFNEYLNAKDTHCKKYINCHTPPINCEVKEAKIYETYTLVDKKPFNKDFPIEINFHTIKENIIINLSLTLLQEQNVVMNYRENLK